MNRGKDNATVSREDLEVIADALGLTLAGIEAVPSHELGPWCVLAARARLAARRAKREAEFGTVEGFNSWVGLIMRSDARRYGPVRLQLLRSLPMEPPAEDDPRKPLPTFNFAGVTAHDGAVLILLPQTTMERRDAIRLAAWLLVGAELAGEHDNPLEQCAELVQRIRAT